MIFREAFLTNGSAFSMNLILDEIMTPKYTYTRCGRLVTGISYPFEILDLLTFLTLI